MSVPMSTSVSVNVNANVDIGHREGREPPGRAGAHLQGQAPGRRGVQELHGGGVPDQVVRDRGDEGGRHGVAGAAHQGMSGWDGTSPFLNIRVLPLLARLCTNYLVHAARICGFI